jgi:hypothetical protein
MEGGKLEGDKKDVLAPLVMDEHTMFLLLFLTKTHHVFDAHY